jgi:hypothetical protein
VSFTLKREIYCHDIKNPPSEDRQSEINLDLTGSKLIKLTRNPPLNVLHSELPFETPYSIEITNPNLVGFSSDDSTVLIMEFRNHEVHLQDSIVVRDHASVTIGTRDNVKEDEVIQLFRKLQEFKRFDILYNSSLPHANLDRSLSEFEDAMSPSSVLTKFKHLFNSLEYSVNMDGKDRVGAEFDDYVCDLVRPWPLQNTNVKDWGDIYNRVKHIERNLADLERYHKGSNEIVNYIVSVREAVREVVLKQLR